MLKSSRIQTGEETTDAPDIRKKFRFISVRPLIVRHMQRQSTQIEVWDPLLRSFHWLLVIAFAVAWWSEGSNIQMHLLAGSIIPGLLLFRLIWGFSGEHHALFSSFYLSIQAIRQHLIELRHLNARHYTGHTPIGSLMIYVLIVALFALGISGMWLGGMQMGIGPFSGWVAEADFATEVLVQQVHHWCFDVLQILIAVHLAGIAVESVLQKNNLTVAMITGRKYLKETDQ